MRIPKNPNRKVTDKPTVKQPSQTGDESSDDMPTPGTFDPDEFDIDFMDMMPYPSQFNNPFYTGDLYSYSSMPGNFPSMTTEIPFAAPVDMYDDNGHASFLSPGSSTQDGEESEIPSVASVAMPYDANAVDNVPYELMEQLKPQKKYSMNVKVKNPETVSHTPAIVEEIQQHPGQSDGFQEVLSPKPSVSASPHPVQRPTQMQQEQDKVLLMHDYASPSISDEVEVESSFNEAIPATRTLTAPPQSRSAVVQDNPQLNQPSLYPLPEGAIILENGTILIPTNNKSMNISKTETFTGTSSRPKITPLSLSNSSSSDVVTTSDFTSMINQKQLTQGGRTRQSLGNRTVPAIIESVESSEAVLVPIKKMKSEMDVSEATGGEFGPSTPTSSTSYMMGDGDANVVGTTLQQGGLAGTSYQGARTGTLSRNGGVAKGRADSSKRTKSRGKHVPKIKAVKREIDAEVAKPLKSSKVTPVSTITDIVGLEDTEDSSGDLLKEAASKPIKHRTDVNHIESAKERSVKNAINARVNRQKHKVYVQALEEENSALKQETHDLKQENGILQDEKDIMNKEIVYLKRVIANQSALANVLSGLSNIKDIALTSSFVNDFKQVRKKSADSSMDSVSTSKRHRASPGENSPANRSTGGICVHVSGENASIELCQKCAEMASHAIQSD